jgi:hypothetical protein
MICFVETAICFDRVGEKNLYVLQNTINKNMKSNKKSREANGLYSKGWVGADILFIRNHIHTQCQDLFNRNSVVTKTAD